MLTEEDKKILKTLYMEGRSGKEIAERTGKPHSTIRQLITKEGWKAERSTIAKLPKLDQQVRESVIARVVQNASLLASKRIEEHLQSVLDASGKAMRSLVDNLDQVSLPPVLEHQSMECLIRSIDRTDQLRRRSLGLPSTIQAVDLSSGGQSLHQNALAILDSCKALVRDGKVNAQTLDVAQLQHEMLQDSEDGKANA